MFKKQEHQGVIVYSYCNRDVRELNKYGDVLYHSCKMWHRVLYVNKEKAENIIKEISGSKFVKEVSLSQFDNIDKNFAGNLARF